MASPQREGRNKTPGRSLSIVLSEQNHMTVDEDVILLTPDAPVTKVRYHCAGWNHSKSRCEPEGDTLYELPIPTEFGYSPDTWDGLTPNACAAILMPDGRTLQQFQPFARCTCGRSGGTCRYRKRN
jgi:hypothetical protein